VERCSRDYRIDLHVAASLDAFVEIYTPDRPSCLVLDVELPGDREVDLLETLKASRAPVGVIAVGAEGRVPIIVRALKAGALHFVEKPFEARDLLESLPQALEEATRRFVNARQWQDFEGRLRDLTDREREILCHVVLGKANKLIAWDLRISERTVEVHRFRLLRKMRVSSAVELARLVGAFECNGGATQSLSATRILSSSSAA
jgi:FixJ family two-component response regulator